MKRLFVVVGIAASFACAKKSGDLDPAPPGKKSVQVVAADQAAKDFQAEANAIKGDSDIDYSDVAGRMESVTSKHPTYGLAWYNLGVAYEQLGKNDEAARAYRKALSTNKKLREAQENLAALAVKRGEPDEAIMLLQDLIERDPGAAEARVALATHYLQRGDLDEAKTLSRDALGYQPKNIDAYCVLAQAAVKEKDALRARLVAAQGLKLDGNASCLHYVLGLVALSKKDLAAAIVSFESAIAKDASLLEARFHVAQISMGFKDFKKAIDNYTAVTNQNPKATAAFVNLGVAYKGSGQFENAEAAYKKAIDAAGTDGAPAAHYNLGVLYLRNMNKLAEAKGELKRFLQLSDGGDNDAVFGMLEEIEKLEQLAIEEKRMMEEAERQAEIDAKIAAEEAKKKAEEEKRAAEEAKRAAEAGEPKEPEKAAPPPEEKKEEPKKKKVRRKKTRRSKPKPKGDETPAIPEPDDFE